MANTKQGEPADGEREEAISRLLRGTAQEDAPVRAAVVQALASRGRASDSLLRLAMAGLLGLTGMALGGTLYLIADGNPGTEPQLALTAFVGLLDGLLGLLIGAR
jgi:hypothetical protein